MKAARRPVSIVLSLILALAMVFGCTTAAAAAVQPPISGITTSLANSRVEFVVDGEDAHYEIHAPGATPAQLSDVDLTVTSAVTGVNKMWLACGSVQGYREGEGDIVLEGCDLSVSSPSLFVAWGPSIGEATGYTYPLVINTAPITIDLGAIAVTPSQGVPLQAFPEVVSTFTGAIYRYVAAFPAGTAAGSLQNATVSFTTAADVSLRAGGTSVADTGSGDEHTFCGVNLTTGGGVTIVVADADTHETRSYAVISYVEGTSVSVKIAIRTFPALAWLNEDYSEYDYEANGYGTPSDWNMTPSRINALREAAETLAFAGNDHSWVTIGGMQRVTFDPGDYITLELPAGSAVMDALEEFADYAYNEEGISIVLHPHYDYIDYMTVDGVDLGRLGCGLGSGWMYTVKPYEGQTWLPDMYASHYILTGEEEINWIYTCAYGGDVGWSFFPDGPWQWPPLII